MNKVVKIMFSVHVGDSMAHVFRTRNTVNYLISKGYKLIYPVPSKAMQYLEGFVDKGFIIFNDQNYSYARFSIQPNLSDYFYRHAYNEAQIYQKFQPDLLICDPGFIPYTYKPDVPIIKILDRFYLEIATNMSSPYLPTEKMIIRKNAEEVINCVRKRMGFDEDFSYDDFLKPYILVNGASFFVSDVKSTYQFIGNNMKLEAQAIEQPNYSNCLVSFGTGLGQHQISSVSAILKFIESYFDRIYFSYGFNIDKTSLYQPPNSIMEPIFDSVPPNIGVLICHGGYGIIHLGAQLGIPILAIPFQMEQYSNAHKLEELGIGINLGTYNKNNFKGLYESFQINWDLFENSLNNVKTIRKKQFLEDIYKTKENLLNKYIEDFIHRRIF